MDDSMDVDNEQPLVRLKTSDGKRFELTKSQASCSNALRTMIETYQNNSNTPTEYINLAVHSRLLEKVVEWIREHCDSASSNISADDDRHGDSDATCRKASRYEVTKADKEFLAAMTELELFKLTHVASYLDVRTLFDACCQTIAKNWEDKKVIEIRAMYNIDNDFSGEEEMLMISESRRLGMSD